MTPREPRSGRLHELPAEELLPQLPGHSLSARDGRPRREEMRAAELDGYSPSTTSGCDASPQSVQALDCDVPVARSGSSKSRRRERAPPVATHEAEAQTDGSAAAADVCQAKLEVEQASVREAQLERQVADLQNQVQQLQRQLQQQPSTMLQKCQLCEDQRCQMDAMSKEVGV